MKLVESLNPKRLIPTNRRGVALVTVLTVMALTTILILTFFSLATSEHKASFTYSNGLQAQQVGEQAVNMVIAQIRDATTVGTAKAWASQPGAIRQWDDSGNHEYAYKLYSDEVMKTEDWSAFQEDFMDLAGWSNKPDHYVDLNEPVIRGQKVYYPIVHPAAEVVPEWGHKLGDDEDGVEGFSFNQLSGRKLADEGEMGEKAARVVNQYRDQKDKPVNGHVAMPVKWIYQLADGTLGVLDQGRQFQRLTSGGGTPSEHNRIVARFAFWADDETSKLNINTHAGGLAWDVPKAGGELDMKMGEYQPAQHEWQRYPGHPASTHLGPALAPGVLDIVNDRKAMEMLYGVVPRVVEGGSKSGTRKIDTRVASEANGLIADKEPLFPTLDDVIMRSDRKPHQFPDPHGRAIPDEKLSEYLERSKFFITANSRAPETNMFNLPRIAIWPIYNAQFGTSEYSEKLTPFDRLMHYCASMGENTAGGYPRNEYIFKREDADSTTYDYERIERNRDLYAYLLDLMERNVPGYGDSFASKYPSKGHQQILTEIFDYIRTTNLHDDSIYGENFEKAFTDGNTNTAATYTNPRDKRNPQIGHKGHGQVVPIKIDGTKGFGRFYSLGSVQVHVISCAEPGDIPLPRNFGTTSYRKQNVQMSNVAQIEESIYPNFPPHPYGFEKPANLASPPPDYIANEPAWLKGLRENNQPLYLAAMNPANWNWQLAYLDSGYLNAVLAAPSANKFSRRALNMGAFTNGTTRLKDTEQLVQGALYFNLFTPSIGWGSINPDMEIMVEVLGNSTNDSMYFQVAPGSPLPNDKAQFLGFVPGILGNHDKDRWIFATNRTDSAWGGRRYGGLMPYEYALNAGRDFTQRLRERVLKDAGLGADYLSPFEKFNFVNGAQPNKDAGQAFGGTYARKDTYQWDIHGGRSRVTPLDRGYDLLDGVEVDKTTKEKLDNKNAQSYRYDLVTIPFKVTGASVNGSLFTPGEIEFHGGDLKFSFYHGGERSERSAPNGDKKNYGFDGGEVIQEVTVYIPEFHFGGSKSSNGPYGLAPVMFDRNQAGNDNYQRHLGGRYNDEDALWKDSFSFFERNSLGADPGNPYIVESGSALKRGGNNRVTIHENSAGLNFASYAAPVASGRFAHLSVHDRPTLFSPNDIVQSVEIRHGDARISAGRAVIEKNEVFAPHREYNKTPMAHSATGGTGSPYYGAVIDPAYLIRPGLGNGAYGYGTSESRIPLPFGVERSDKEQLYGDFDNGSGLMIDGPYINKPDEGNTHSLKGKFMKEVDDQWGWLQQRGEFPYFNRDDIQESGGPAYFSPNRLVSGPGMFGSLPTGVLTDEPWRTLLFRPATNGTEPGFQRHPGGGEQEGGTNPPDHLIMDLFWMPVVEPYAISEPLSTGGKVNMNFDIVPFQHIQRSTALRGVFRSELMLCIPNQWHQDYKHNFGRGRGYHWRDKPTGGSIQFRRLRAAIREDDTIAQFYDRFDNGGEIFKSATEICEIDLIPEEMQKRMNLPASTGINSYVPTKQEMDSGKYWKDHSLVGDNSRERPYTNIQTRLTTKSNTFLVHYRAQVLKQARRDSSGGYVQWDPETDTVQAEYRGSSLVERYVNPDADDIPDFAHGSADGLDAYYRYRVVNPRRFAP